MHLGKIEVRFLDGGTFGLDGGAMFGVVPKVLWEKKSPDGSNRIQMRANSLLVRVEKRNILIETGNGTKMDTKLRSIGDAEILPGISVACIPGHNTNIQAVVITAGGRTSPLLQIYYRRVTIFLCPGSWLTTSTRFRALLRRTESLSSATILTSPRRRSISGTAKLKSNRSI